jgi:FMN phosphatase YigB (HAD superfamily)
VISGDVGFKKPSDEIYKILLERIGCNANDSVIIDDKHENLVPALKMGMKWIKFNRGKIAADDYKGFEIKTFIQLPEYLPKVFA